MTEELIRKSDALAAVHLGDAVTKLQARIATLPAVTVGVKPLAFEGRNGFWRADDGIGGFYEVTEVYSAFHMCRIVVGVANKLIPYNSKDAAFGAANVEHQRRILAALTPTPVDASQPADAVVNAPDYRLAPHLQRIVEGAKTAPQWDTEGDRMAAPDRVEYERKVAQMKEDFPNGI